MACIFAKVVSPKSLSADLQRSHCQFGFTTVNPDTIHCRQKFDQMSDAVAQFQTHLQNSLNDGTFISLVIAKTPKQSADIPRKQSVRPVTIKREQKYQWSQQFEKQQSHLNRSQEETLKAFRSAFPRVYREAYLFTTQGEWTAKKFGQEVQLKHKAVTQAAVETGSHNRQKQYLIPEDVPCQFLIALDVMSADGRVKQSSQKKFRQINRYLEMVNDIIPSLPSKGTLRVVDFGCGLSYLTFALHHLLTVIHGREVDMVGIDQNQHVINRCQQIASNLHCAGLRFETGKIQRQSTTQTDLAVSLHACDTATDHALAYSVRSGAKVILAAPCCQHELAKQIESATLQPLLKHGILKERFAALATDSLRAAALEEAGYQTQILEFIELEHTPKNLLIRAVRRKSAPHARKETYSELKANLGAKELATDAILQAITNLELSAEHSPK